ncbi:MAG: hypothetical protein IPL65_02025 [Lewinellaceae bacterium]|nr:hypothetical protein [Lewinellaceae bacterium]
MKIAFTLFTLGLLLVWESPDPVFVANAQMNVGSSVQGMLCPDPALTWPCSVSSSSSGNAPPAVSCPVMLSKDKEGRITILLQKSGMTPSMRQNWIQGSTLYSPQTIEIERGLSQQVLNIDEAIYIEAGRYPITETASSFEVKF